MPKISIIIVNWNTGPFLLKCLQSIASLPEQEIIGHVVVVDNASEDESIELAKEFAKEHGYPIFLEKRNLGFAKANNQGWKYITEHEGEDHDILLLNPDTELRPKSLMNMRDALNRNPKAGIVGPMLLEQDGTIQQSVRTFPTLGVFALLFLKLQRVLPFLPSWKKYMMKSFNYSKEQVVDQVMGAAFLIRSEVTKQLGLLDEDFWIWFEEVDFCKRAKNVGWNTLYTPTAKVLHYGGVSFGQLMGLARTKPFLASSLVYTRKHLGIFAYILLLLLYPVAFGIAWVAPLAYRKR